MNIERVRQADRATRMGVLIDELSGKDGVPGPLAAIRLESGLKKLQKYSFTIRNGGVRLSAIEPPDHAANKMVSGGSPTSRTYNSRVAKTKKTSSESEPTNAYDFLRDYLGLGETAPYLLSAIETYYPQLSNRPDGQMTYPELDAIADSLLRVLRNDVFKKAEE